MKCSICAFDGQSIPVFDRICKGGLDVGWGGLASVRLRKNVKDRVAVTTGFNANERKFTPIDELLYQEPMMPTLHVVMARRVRATCRRACLRGLPGHAGEGSFYFATGA